MTISRWAVILCKFADDQSVTQPLTHYQRLFTGVGTGSLNMVDFFRDMSHGQLDLSGSQVLGPFTLKQNKSDYAGNVVMPPAGKFNRNGLFELCRQAAIDNGTPLDTFDGVVVSMNGGVDLWGGPPGVMRAFCDSHSLSPSPLGQEMGHGYGLDHARQDGSELDYMDPWDVMSVYDSTVMALNSEWGTVGPGLNAQCMRSRGWLDETRVWKPSSDSFNTVIQLRPLHRYDLPGLLAAELPGGYLVEYRAKERWNAAFSQSAVFVHRFDDNHSYVMAGTSGNFNLGVGDTFERGSQQSVIGPFTHMDVVAIDDNARVATIHLINRSAFEEPSLGPGILFGGVAKGGDGIVILPGGTIKRVPPRSPLFQVLEQVAIYESSQSIASVQIRNAVRQETLSAIVALAENQMQTLQAFRQPAPPQQTQECEGE